MKKIWMILLIVAGIAGIAGAVGYFFFWEDLRLIFGAAPKGGKAADGGVDLVAEFVASESGSKDPSPAAAPPAEETQPEESAGEDAPAESEGPAEDASASEDGVDLGEGGGEESEEVSAEEEPEAAPAPPKKTEPVPTLARKTETPPPPARPAAAPSVTVPPARPPAPPKRPQGADAQAPKESASAGSADVQKKAQSLIQKRKYPEAEALLKQYLAAHPQDGDVHFMMGFLMMQQNRKGAAIPFFQKAVQGAKDPQIRQMAEQYLKKLR